MSMTKKIYSPYINCNTVFSDVYNWFEEKGLYDPVMQCVKVNEEVGELCHEVSRSTDDLNAISDAIGDSIITLIGMAHAYHLDPSLCLYDSWGEIKKRTGKVINGSFVKDESGV